MKIFSLLLLLTITACASKPKLYPNSAYQKYGKVQADRDIEICMAKADEFLESDRGRQMVREGGKGAAWGAIVGAVASAVFGGNAGKGAAQGAAIGGASGAASAGLSEDQIKQRFVNRCLAEKGYEVIGWR
ncbi:cell envelope biogenesis protein OmpA [Halobacteriovorax sp. HFRX-2_2]|uniref:cell envelope biogenesis protein OmpA n=1 Tax=unclassified Halobacteriovorax TaxID=2639665 RepID=UPI0037157EB1